MDVVKRIYVEKKPGFDVEAKNALADFKENLSISGLTGVRIVLRYDTEGIAEEDFEAALTAVFSEPAVDYVYPENLPETTSEYAFAVEYLPGQYDQRADSAAECVQLLTMKARPLVVAAKVYLLEGYLSATDIDTIKSYVINPVDSREADMEKPKTLVMQLAEPADVETVVGFIGMSDAALETFRIEGGYAMSTADLIVTRDYFAEQKRDPTITELKVIDTYWSDHCRHTTFLTELTDVSFEEGLAAAKIEEAYHLYQNYRADVYGKDTDRPESLMDIATIYAKAAKKKGLLPDLDESEEINACSIKHTLETEQGTQDYLVMFKNETHNHPTEIEPFGGAATCLGGAIRDPLSGRSYVYQAMRVTGSGDPRERTEDTMEYKLPQRKITKEAAAGYSAYGNQIGLATGLVKEIYHEGYKAKRMEIGAVIGAAPAKNVVRERPEKGDQVVLIGGRTGRDGIGGATGSSKAHDESSTAECGAEVQKGNPPTERKLQRLFRNPAFTTLVKRCNDFGAGGVSVAIGELAESLDIYLDRVPKKYEGLDGTELAISESQERMAVVVQAKDVAEILAYAAEENLEATVVAEITDNGRMRMFWRDKAIVDIARAFLDTNGAAQYAKVKVENADIKSILEVEAEASLKDTVKNVLADLNVCSQKGLGERFGNTIGRGTILMPFGGKNKLTPIQTMTALIPVLGDTAKDATFMSYGMDPYLLERSPFHGAVYAVLSSVAKIVAAGGDHNKVWLTLQEYFESLEDVPTRWGKPFSALLGALYAQEGLGAAAIGGKDSMSGTFRDLTVPPTLCSFAVAVGKAEEVISPEFKKAGNKVYLLDLESDQFSLPVFAAMQKKYDAFYQLIKEKKIKAAYAIEQGGILAAVTKMAMGNEIGITLKEDLSLMQLIRKQYGAIVFETAEEMENALFEEVGVLTEAAEIRLAGEKVALQACIDTFEAPLESVFPTRVEQGVLTEIGEDYKGNSTIKPSIKIAQPRVVIPVFPGTNCEYDTAAYFEKEGAVANTVIIRNLTPADIENSVDALVKEIENSQIIMIPGGFSGGDEPDGSGKFIATVFRNPKVADAVMHFLKERDGLMLGICNGFQALIKLGLVPYGEIRPMREDSPTLTFNSIGRHVSCMVNTRVASVNSPWLKHVSTGDVHTLAVCHGEGRFVCTEEELSRLAANGQIATQYCDEQGNPSMDIGINPNGSFAAVEGLLSPDGRIFGKMAHNERYIPGLMRNILGDKDQNLAKAGVEYFL
ncbi:MAG: phosphoribosylformylglycinamidine synthase [Christensenellaceae bacterium]|jgi:phosphoribosylformylglycinamidine synthase